MIFFTVGTELPFDRLARAVDSWCASHPETTVFGQLGDLGTDDYRPRNFEWSAMLSPVDYEKRCVASDLMIGHAGMGTIIAAMTHIKPLIMMPRRAAFREHRNDHQVATAQKLRERPGVFVAEDESGLHRLLEDILSHRQSHTQMEPISQFADPRLLQTIRRFIFDD